MKYNDVPNEVIYKAFDDSWRLERATSFSGNISYDFTILGRRINNYPSSFRSVFNLSKKDIENVTRTCAAFLSVKKKEKCTFEDFTKEYSERLRHYKKNSVKYYIDCYSICYMEKITALTKKMAYVDIPNDSAVLEDKEELKKIPSQYRSPVRDLGEDPWYFNLILIASFFSLGAIAYIFKHILAFFWFVIAYICFWLIHAAYYIFCLLFAIDGDMILFDPLNIMAEPLTAWQIGGWIYGTIVVGILLWQLFHWLHWIGKPINDFLVKHFANE